MRTLAVDYGARRIGLAISDASGTLARPLATIEGRRTPDAAAAAVAEAIAEFERAGERVAVLVVGNPTRLDGSPNDQTPHARAFARALERRASGRPVVLQDERLTSHEAERLLATRERDWRVRKARLDAAAAAVILQEYLDLEPGGRAVGSADGNGEPEA